ncbi:adenine phosphoribosyl transferase [Lucifera butyrica]|uniref:Adenine phosphoribosyltransferase n=1 Tax=Lucifera butyrica TaxID=1351585 RepID=A0A498R6Z7_9FIRM|nr:adenine phosphoribosyltransferase [Lucifera butyrica]VBB06042.1 adenine phosphoribosyl transferase [Lucifera butyrica]
MDYKQKIRVIPDFPEPGIRFIDITTLLKDGANFRSAIDDLAAKFKNERIDLVVGPEARGFVVGTPVAYALGAGFVPVRKPGKLPAPTSRFCYDLEYGKDALEIHKDAIKPGQRVLIVDDLLATGGTTRATIKLVEELDGVIAGLAFMIELSYLNGRQTLPDYKVVSLVQY